MIRIIHDKDPIWEVEKYDVVLVGVSIYNSMPNGFQMKIANKYPEVREANKSTNYADTRKYGKRLDIEGDEGHPTISLLFISGYRNKNKPSTNYEALENALTTANVEFKGKKVLTTMLGASRFDGGGDYDKCLEIIERCTKDMYVDIYDCPQYTRDEEYRRIMHEIHLLKIKSKEEFKEAMLNRFQIMKDNYIRKIDGEAKATEKRQRRKKERASNK